MQNTTLRASIVYNPEHWEGCIRDTVGEGVGDDGAHRGVNALDEISLDELSEKSLSERGRASLHNDTGILEGCNLGVCAALTSADDGTSVAHSSTWWSTDTGNEADSRLVGPVLALQESGSVFLSATADLTDHDDSVSLLILEEDTEAVNEVGSGEWVAADADNERLAKTGLGGLVDGFVGKGTGSGDDTDTASLVDEAGHDTNFALSLRREWLAYDV